MCPELRPRVPPSLLHGAERWIPTMTLACRRCQTATARCQTSCAPYGTAASWRLQTARRFSRRWPSCWAAPLGVHMPDVDLALGYPVRALQCSSKARLRPLQLLPHSSLQVFEGVHTLGVRTGRSITQGML